MEGRKAIAAAAVHTNGDYGPKDSAAQLTLIFTVLSILSVGTLFNAIVVAAAGYVCPMCI